MSQPRSRIPWIALCVCLLCAACEREDPAGTPDTATPTAPAQPSGAAQTTSASATEGTTAPTDALSPTSETPPQAPAGFVQATLRQEELRGIALGALDRGDLNLGIAALISLMETAEMSDLKASGMLLLSQLYHNEGDSDRALAILAALTAQAPPMAEFEFTLGRTLNELGRAAEAEAHLRRAIELNPEFLQSYLHLGSLLVAEGRTGDAEPVFLSYERALAGIIQRLSDVERPLPVRLQAADQLATANPDSRITEALVRLLDEDNLAMQGTAIQLLAQVGTPDALPALQSYADRADHAELRAAAGQAAQLIAANAQ